MKRKIPETQDERFLDYYQKIENGEQPSFVGIHFDSKQYADLADLLLNKIDYHFSKGELIKAAFFIEYIQKLRSRKRMRFFDETLYEKRI